MGDDVGVHERAMHQHERAAQLQDRSADYWAAQGDTELADLARRRAAYQRTGRDIEADHARLLTHRRDVAPERPTEPDGKATRAD